MNFVCVSIFNISDKIDKPSKDVPIRRKTEPKLSETDSENGAI